MDLRTKGWQCIDRAHFLHPFTGHKETHQTRARIAVRAEGVYVWDSDGNKIRRPSSSYNLASNARGGSGRPV